MRITIQAEGKPGTGKTTALKKLLGNLEIQGFTCYVNEAKHEIIATKEENPQVSLATAIAKTFFMFHQRYGMSKEVAQHYTDLVHKLK
jgi:broad-specificity NMP kinase